MTKYCPNCYVGVEPDDKACANCGAELTPDKVEMKESFDEVQITEELVPEEKAEAEVPREDPEDSADIVVAEMIEDNSCGEPEEQMSPFDNNPAEEKISQPMMNSYQETFEEKAKPQASYSSYDQEPAPKVMGLGEWLLTIFLVCIPIVNLVMLIYWSAGNEIDPNKKNYARAQLIIMAIGVVISFFFFGSIVAMILAFSNYYYY